jgi:hypothetical protein
MGIFSPAIVRVGRRRAATNAADAATMEEQQALVEAAFHVRDLARHCVGFQTK